jgi:hypothetical protein
MLIFIIGFSFVVIAFLGTTDFGRKFNMITGELFSDKIPILIMFTSGCVGTYIFLCKIWISEKEKITNYYFLFGFSILNIIASLSIISWLYNAIDDIQLNFAQIPFATEVDLVTKNVRSSLLETVSYMIFMLMLVGIASLALGFYHLKTVKKD